MPSRTTYLRLVGASAIYDLAVSLPFATPWTLGLVWGLLGAVQSGLGLAPLPILDPHAVLFGNFFGTVVTLWAAVRLTRPAVTFGRYDAAARFAFAAWMMVALSHGATPLLFGFLAVELAFGLAQALPLREAGA